MKEENSIMVLLSFFDMRESSLLRENSTSLTEINVSNSIIENKRKVNYQPHKSKSNPTVEHINKYIRNINLSKIDHSRIYSPPSYRNSSIMDNLNQIKFPLKGDETGYFTTVDSLFDINDKLSVDIPNNNLNENVLKMNMTTLNTASTVKTIKLSDIDKNKIANKKDLKLNRESNFNLKL